MTVYFLGIVGLIVCTEASFVTSDGLAFGAIGESSESFSQDVKLIQKAKLRALVVILKKVFIVLVV
ncbi:hypothetical protein GCM10027592_59380 [Spirosoma flavus]